MRFVLCAGLPKKYIYRLRGPIQFPSTAKRKLERLQFQLHHRLSKFEVPVVVNLTFWDLYHLLFDLETIEVN